MPKATASHILVADEDQAQQIKTQLDQGKDFSALAKKHSLCPSGKAGGSLGAFDQGAMVPAFDQVVFSDLDVGTISEPVKTQFGYHLIRVDSRN